MLSAIQPHFALQARTTPSVRTLATRRPFLKPRFGQEGQTQGMSRRLFLGGGFSGLTAFLLQPQRLGLGTLAEAGTNPLFSPMLEQFSKIAKAVTPAIVYIEAFGKPTKNKPQTPALQGTGAIFDQEGHILTVAHLVEKTSGYKVRFPDDRVLDAALIGFSPGKDIAVLKVPEDSRYNILSFSDSRPEILQPLLAIGHPEGLVWSTQILMVSHVDRKNMFRQSHTFQLDGPIHPGHSGTVLFNTQGEMVGMVVANAPTLPGVSFALFAHDLKTTASGLIAQQRNMPSAQAVRHKTP